MRGGDQHHRELAQEETDGKPGIYICDTVKSNSSDVDTAGAICTNSRRNVPPEPSPWLTCHYMELLSLSVFTRLLSVRSCICPQTPEPSRFS